MILLPQTFYLPDDPIALARALLGKVLLTDIDGTCTTARIVETEAYKAPEDRGSHAHNNRRTARTEVFFAPGGLSYVYICYGTHFLFNIVTGRKDVPHAILVRAVEPLSGEAHMLRRRKMPLLKPELCNGPGKVAQALGIDKNHYGLPVYSAESAVRIYDDQWPIAEENIVASARVGMAFEGPYATIPWRFRVKGNPWAGK